MFLLYQGLKIQNYKLVICWELLIFLNKSSFPILIVDFFFRGTIAFTKTTIGKFLFSFNNYLYKFNFFLHRLSENCPDNKYFRTLW